MVEVDDEDVDVDEGSDMVSVSSFCAIVVVVDTNFFFFDLVCFCGICLFCVSVVCA